MAAIRIRRNYNFDQWSVKRDGLVSINFITNVRNLDVDIRRKQVNEATTISNRGGRLIEDEGERYSVFNSDPKFDVNQELSNSELFDSLTVQNIRLILNTFRIPFNNGAIKAQLIQSLSNMLRANPERINFVREVHSRQIAALRNAIARRGVREANTSLLVSNKHKYSKTDFDGMSFKNILRSLFDIDYHTVFVYRNVLKGKKIPEVGAKAAIVLRKKILAEQAQNPLYGGQQNLVPEIADPIFESASIKSDRILKHNTQIVLDVLFKSRRRFFLEKKPYTILAYHQENGPTQDPEEGLEMPDRSRYVTYTVELYIELSELPPEKVSDKEIQKANCHVRSEKIRKDWFDIWHTPGPYGRFNSPVHRFIRNQMGYPALPEDAQANDVFERKHYQTLTRKNINRGGSKNHKKTQKHRR